MFGFKWSNVDLPNSQFRVKEILRHVTGFDKESGNNTIVKSLQTTKTDSSNRSMPPIPELKNKRLENKRWQDYTKRQNPAFNPQGFVFTTEQGSCIEPRTYQDLLKRILREAGVADANFHSLRHTFSTRAIERGMDVFVLAKIFGRARPIDGKRKTISGKTQAEVRAKLREINQPIADNVLDIACATNNGSSKPAIIAIMYNITIKSGPYL